jgi:hypothetical protein
MDIDKNARQTRKGRERASRSAKRWRLPALSSRLLAAYGSRRGRAVILRLEASGDASWREAAHPSRDGRRQKGRLWPLGFFKCSRSNVSLSITSQLALQFYEFGPFGGALNGPPGE